MSRIRRRNAARPGGESAHVSPPVPAPYLVGVPSIDNELLNQLHTPQPSPAAVARARATIVALRQVIRRARQQHEAASGVVIEPEPPWPS